MIRSLLFHDIQYGIHELGKQIQRTLVADNRITMQMMPVEDRKAHTEQRNFRLFGRELQVESPIARSTGSWNSSERICHKS